MKFIQDSQRLLEDLTNPEHLRRFSEFTERFGKAMPRASAAFPSLWSTNIPDYYSL